MKMIIHRSEDRGTAEYGWLHAKHSFSFGNWYNPEQMGFGLLRVLNDDIVEPARGFGTHPHNNMEIITIILEGALEHKDSMGSGSVIYPGEVQVMSAGYGVTHSEFNASKEDKTNLLQIWIMPKEINIKPRYDQKKFSDEDLKNNFVILASGFNDNGSLYIHQNALIARAKPVSGSSVNYRLKNESNGVYLFVITGSVEINNEQLFRRDAAGLTGIDEIKLSFKEDSDILLLEVPMG